MLTAQIQDLLSEINEPAFGKNNDETVERVSKVIEMIESIGSEIKECVHVRRSILLYFKKLRRLYSKRFPELESVSLSPLEYAKTVKTIGNTTVRRQLSRHFYLLGPNKAVF